MRCVISVNNMIYPQLLLPRKKGIRNMIRPIKITNIKDIYIYIYIKHFTKPNDYNDKKKNNVYKEHDKQKSGKLKKIWSR